MYILKKAIILTVALSLITNLYAADAEQLTITPNPKAPLIKSLKSWSQETLNKALTDFFTPLYGKKPEVITWNEDLVLSVEKKRIVELIGQYAARNELIALNISDQHGRDKELLDIHVLNNYELKQVLRRIVDFNISHIGLLYTKPYELTQALGYLNPELSRLDVSFNGPTKVRNLVSFLWSSGRGPKLKYLNISGAGFEDEVKDVLVFLVRNCPNLKELELSANCITPKGAAMLGQALGEQEYPLESLNISRNDIGDDGLKAIVFGLSKDALEALGDQGYPGIMQPDGRVRRLPRLKTINFSECRVSQNCREEVGRFLQSKE